MPHAANQISAALRTFLPDIEGAKLHRLLYYVQGHMLALFERQAFTETITAGEDGPEIEGFDDAGHPHQRNTLDGQILNTVMLVSHRYGSLATDDLNRLTRAEPPWQHTLVGTAISPHSLAAFFVRDGAFESPADSPEPTPADIERMRTEVRRARSSAPTQPDDFDALMSKVSRRAAG